MSEDMNKDIGNYRHTANFEVEVFPNVYWIPVCELGASSYTNEQIKELIGLTPEDKCKKITTLYEALQLFVLSDFKGVLDNINHITYEDEHCIELWQTHTSGRNAVLSNEGCCATDTNWLSYLLHAKYDTIGGFSYGNTDGNGHVTSYIKHKGWYYFIDLMMCRTDSQFYGCIESGDKDELFLKEWGGSLFKCQNPIDFVHFTREKFLSKDRDVPFAFYMRHCSEHIATGVKCTPNGITFLVPKEENPELLYLEEGRNAFIEFVDMPVL